MIIINKENHSLNTFRFFAILFVVVIHTQIYLVTTENPYVVLQTLVKLAVPLFFMISGYLLFNNLIRAKDKSIYIKKYVFNLMKIYLIWTVIDGLLMFINELSKGNSFNLLTWIFSVETIYYGHKGYNFYQLWYLIALVYSLIIVYLMRNKIKSLLIISGLTNILGYLLYILNPQINVRDCLFFGLFYTTMGYFIALNEDIILDKTKKFTINKCVLITIVLFIINCIELKLMRKFTPILCDYNLIGIIVCILLFLIAIKKTNILKDSYICKKGRNTLGVYLIHIVIIRLINNMAIIFGFKLSFGMIGYILFILLVYLISDTIIVILKKLLNWSIK